MVGPRPAQQVDHLTGTRSEVYTRLGLRLTDDSLSRVVIAESDPWPRVSATEPVGLNPPATEGNA